MSRLLTPELPVHLVLVQSLLVPPHSPAAVVTKKAVAFTRDGHRIVQFFSHFFAATKAYKCGRLSDGHIAMKLNKTHFRPMLEANTTATMSKNARGATIIALGFDIARVLDHSLWFLCRPLY